MKDFDTERAGRLTGDRTFKMHGEVFTHRSAVRPEVLAALADAEEGTTAQAVEVLDAAILQFLEPGQEEKWQRIRADEQDPVTLADLSALVRHLTEATAGRPTEPSSGSSPSPEPTAASSTAASSSPEVAASTG